MEDTDTLWQQAMARLRKVRDAVNALMFDEASQLLVRHDVALREALAQGAAFTVSEVESLRHAQDDLLDQLKAVQRGVAKDLQQTRRSGDAARAYLDAHGA